MRSLLLNKLLPYRALGTVAPKKETSFLTVNGKEYNCDDYTNVKPKIISLLGKNLHSRDQHPLCLLKKRIIDHFYKSFTGRTGNPVFSVYDNLNPVVTVEQNFDSLLIPANHVSRNKSDCYYINRSHLLRGHTTAHQKELVRMGLDNFLIVGDVYRRDEIDSTHYPVFHQIDGVRLLTSDQLSTLNGMEVKIFEKKKDMRREEAPFCQREHTLEATKIMEHQLKSTLVSLAHAIFGKDVQHRWVDVYFPFTHPSWELEIEFEGHWMELLGCGIMRNDIIQSGGAGDRIGWAFGLGLERMAMSYYQIPDIRTFWSMDSGFLQQFENATPEQRIKYKPVSVYPQCINDMSFWLPSDRPFEPNDFFEIIRDVGGDLIEQVRLVDEYTNPKTGEKSVCYRIVYRSVDSTLTQGQVGKVHAAIALRAAQHLAVRIR